MVPAADIALRRGFRRTLDFSKAGARDLSAALHRTYARAWISVAALWRLSTRRGDIGSKSACGRYIRRGASRADARRFSSPRGRGNAEGLAVQVTEGDGYCLGRVLIDAQIAVPLASAAQSRASNRQPFAVAFSAGGDGGRKSPETSVERVLREPVHGYRHVLR
jgi:hypothetical protein